MALTHGYVVGELIYSRTDGPDGDRLPDVVPASDVKLTFTPAARQFVDPDNRLVVADPIPAAVMDDGQVTGDLDEQGNAASDATAGLWLVVGKYRVTAKGHYRDFDITVTEEHTEEDPLVLGAAVEYVPPTVTVQSVRIPTGAANGQVLGWDDGLAWVVPEGVGVSDSTVAGFVEDDSSDTHAAVVSIAEQHAGSGDVASVNGKTGAVVLNHEDVGALPDDWTPDVGDIPNLPASKINIGTFAAARIPSLPYLPADGVSEDADNTAVLGTDGLIYVPESSGGGGDVASVNGQTGTVVLDAEDVGARPDDWTPTAAAVGARADDWTPAVGDVPNLPASKINSGTFDAARIPALPYATQAQGDKADTAVQPADLTNYVTTEDLPAPATAIVYHNGTNWIAPDDTVTTVRPNAQRVMAFGGTTQPGFLVAGDVWVQDTGV